MSMRRDAGREDGDAQMSGEARNGRMARGSRKGARAGLALALAATMLPACLLAAPALGGEQLPTKLVNGSFDYPTTQQLPGWKAVKGNDTYISQDGRSFFTSNQCGAAYSYKWNPIPGFDATRFGWKSTEPGYDLDTNLPIPAQTVQVNFDDQDQNAYGEIEITLPGHAIYQDIATTPGSLYKWRLKHSSLSSAQDDAMEVRIGAPGDETAQEARRITSNGTGAIGEVGTSIKTHNVDADGIYRNSWETYTGSYVVPEGQTITRFTFKSIEWSGAGGGGNNIDDVSFAKYDPVVYDLNGGASGGIITSVADAQADGYVGYFEEDAAHELTDAVPEREGCTFMGWSSEKLDVLESDEAIREAEDSIIGSVMVAPGANTVYAVWRTNAYRIRFDANGGTGQTDELAMRLGQEAPLASCGFTRPGWSWQRWNTEPDGTGDTFYAEERVSDLAREDGATVTLYAQWAADPTVTFDDGWGSVLAQQTIPSGSAAEPPEVPEKTGYVFTGWSAPFDDIVHDALVHAQWRPVAYAIAFDANGGEGAMESIQLDHGQAAALPTCTFTRDDMAFAGWGISPFSAESAFADEDLVCDLSEEDGCLVTLYAQWASREHPIRFDANGGTGQMEPLVANATEETVLPACSFQMPGKRFCGWGTVPDGSVAFADGASIAWEGACELETLYAIWDEGAPVVITYVPDDPVRTSLSRYSDEVAPFSGQAKGSRATANRGYAFDRWVTSDGELACSTADITPERDAAGAYVPATYRAESHPISYAIRYDANGGEGSMARADCVFGEAAEVAGNPFSFEGKSFAGWSTDLSGSGRMLYPGDTVYDLADEEGSEAVLYALWEDGPTASDGEGPSGGAAGADPDAGDAYGDPSIHEGYGTIAGPSRADRLASTGAPYDKTGDAAMPLYAALLLAALGSVAGTACGIWRLRRRAGGAEDAR